MFVLHPKVSLTFLAIPWLNPFAPGPSAAMVPWLVSLACAGAALWIANTGSLKHSHQLSRHVGRALAQLWLGIALVSVLLALCQYLRIEAWFSPWISHSGDGTAYANLRQRNQFATLCGMGLLAVLHLRQLACAMSFAAHAGAREASGLQPSAFKKQWQTAWPWLAVVALAIGNGLSSSRTGAVQWVLIAGLVMLWRSSLHRPVRSLGLAALLIYGLVVAALPWFAQLVGNASTGLWGRAQEGVTGGSRLWLYSNVLELIAQKPWLGWGWRELAYAHYSTHFDTRFVELLDNAHNLPLHLAVELGLPLALLLCGALLWWVVRNAPWRERDAARQLAWGVLMLIGVHSLVEYPLWYGPFVITLGLCLGLLRKPGGVAGKTTFPSTVPQQNRPLALTGRAQAATKLIAIVMLAGTAYAAFDYHRISQIYLQPEQRSTLYAGDPLAQAHKSWLFQKQARFAELVLTPVTPRSAPRVHALAQEMIHFSPEPRVIEALIESATALHRDDEARFHLARYREVYPKDYAAWSALK